MEHPLTPQSTVLLRASQVSMPVVGLGGGLFGADAEQAVQSALELRYRLIDTSPKYGGSEAAVGKALAACEGVCREDVFISTKCGNVGSWAGVLASVDASLEALSTDYVDLLLMHSAVNQSAKSTPQSALHGTARRSTWKAMRRLKSSGRVRAIGVCNFSVRHIQELGRWGEFPDVVQLEFHPWLQQSDTLQFCTEHGIAVQGYGNGGGGWQLWRKEPELYGMLQHPVIQALAEVHQRSCHQISLRWSIQQGLCVIPKAASQEHQQENMQLFDFALSDEEMSALQELDVKRSLYRFKEPDTWL